MASKLIQLNDAAQMLGVSSGELTEMRSSGEIHGYRDGSSWKFKIEEIKRFADDRGIVLGKGSSLELPAAAKNDDDLDDLLVGVEEDADDDVGSVLVSEEELGHSGETTSSTIIGKEESLDDSDLGLAESGMELAEGGSDTPLTDEAVSDLTLADGVTSDLQLIEGTSDPLMPTTSSTELGLGDGEGSQVELEEAVRDTDLELVAGGSDPFPTGSEGKSDTDKLLETESATGSDLELAVDSALTLSDEDDDDLSLSPGSVIDLSEDEDDDLVLSSSGAGSDLTLGAGDSGINLSPTDSGLSLEEEPLDLGGSSVEQLELPEDDDMISLEEDIGDPDAATQLKADDEFLLTPVEEADDESSGSQVIALDEDSAVYDADAQTMLGAAAPALAPIDQQQPLVAADAEMFGDGVEGAAGDQVAQPLTQQVGVPTESLPESKYSVWNVLSLLVIMVFLGATGIFVVDLMKNVFGADVDSGPANALMDKIVKAAGMKP